MKRCPRCGEIKASDCFHKNRAQPDGLACHCKSCWKLICSERTEKNKAAHQAYYKANQERLLEANREWCKANPERARVHRKAYAERNVEATRARIKKWGDTHKGHRAKTARERRIKDPVGHAESLRRWRQANVGKVRLQGHRRRALKKNAPGTFTYKGFAEKCLYYGWRCYLCQAPLTLKTVTIEHRIPLSRGGTNWLSNLAPACLSCNSRKQNKTEMEYRESLATAQ